MSEETRVANLKEALVLLKAAEPPDLATAREVVVREIEAEMEASSWTVISPQVDLLVRRLCELLQIVSPPLPNPCGRFMCAPCHIDLLKEPHITDAQ